MLGIEDALFSVTFAASSHIGAVILDWMLTFVSLEEANLKGDACRAKQVDAMYRLRFRWTKAKEKCTFIIRNARRWESRGIDTREPMSSFAAS